LEKSSRANVAGSVLAPVAAVALVALVPLAWGARELRTSWLLRQAERSLGR